MYLILAKKTKHSGRKSVISSVEVYDNHDRRLFCTPYCKVNPVKRIVLESKSEMCKWFIFKRLFPAHFCALRFQYGEHMCSIIQIICNFIFSIILESLNSFKS